MKMKVVLKYINKIIPPSKIKLDKNKIKKLMKKL